MAKKVLDKTSTARIAVQEIKLRRMAQRAMVAAAKLARGGSNREIPKAPSKAGSVLELRHARERGRAITYERKAVLCGKKGCAKLHGPYWYAFWSAGGRVRSVYIGKTFKTVESKCPERL
jgi:hypothetical protein